MSVSFFVEMGEITSYKVSCMCPHSTGEIFEDYENASLRLMIMQEKNISLDGCNDDFCSNGGLHIEPLHDASNTSVINMSNINARDVLDSLGVNIEDEGWAGSFDARDLMARIDIALSIAPSSAEIPTIQERNMVICGREEGYVQNRLREILAVCEDAVNLNREVLWG